MHVVLKDELGRLRRGRVRGWKEALPTSFAMVDDEVVRGASDVDESRSRNVGSTAVVAIVSDANGGDSRAMLSLTWVWGRTRTGSPVVFSKHAGRRLRWMCLRPSSNYTVRIVGGCPELTRPSLCSFQNCKELRACKISDQSPSYIAW